MYNHQEPETQPTNVISTSQVVNLTATMASAFTLAAIFLCFADQRSRTIRRFSVQSAGLGVLTIGIWMVLWIVAAVLGAIPWIGYVFYVLCWLLAALTAVGALLLRVRMMFNAYRGEAYVLPWFGEFLRKFE